MEQVDETQIRRERTIARTIQTPRERPPASPRPTPDHLEGEIYDSHIYEYHRKHGAGACKPIQFVYAGKFSAPSFEEVERAWELRMAERRRRASAEGPLVCNDTRPRYAGLGSVKEFQPYRLTTSSANESSSA